MARIEDHAFLSDTHSTALVSRDGSIDWLCLPRFDAPSILAALEDRERGSNFPQAFSHVALVTSALALAARTSRPIHRGGK